MRQYLFLGRRFSEVKEPSMAMQDKWIKARGGQERTGHWLAQRKQRKALSPMSHTLVSPLLFATHRFIYLWKFCHVPNDNSQHFFVVPASHAALSPQKHERTNLYCQVNEGGSKCPSNIISNNNNIRWRPWKNYYHLNYKTCKHFPPTTLNNTLNPRGDLSANCIKISLGIAKGLPSTIEEICICKWTRSLRGTGDEKNLNQIAAKIGSILLLHKVQYSPWPPLIQV